MTLALSDPSLYIYSNPSTFALSLTANAPLIVIDALVLAVTDELSIETLAAIMELTKHPITSEITSSILSTSISAGNTQSPLTVQSSLTITAPNPTVLIFTETLPLDIGDIQFNKTLNPQTLELLMSDILDIR